MGRIQEYSMLNCAVNPQAARERVTQLNPVLNKKKVLIIGGGVAGCEAARVLKMRGHEPVIYEKSSRLGGNLIPGGVPDFKEDDIALADWFNNEIERLNIPVYLNDEVSKEFIEKYHADAVIIATGSNPKIFSLGDDENVHTASEVLITGAKTVGEEIVVIGGGLVGCETALWLAQQGKKVTIIEALNKLLALNGPLCHANSEMLEKLIPYNHIDTITNSKAKKYEDGILKVETPDGIKNISCDSIVLSIGYSENNKLFDELQFEIPEIYLLGDARKVANIMYGIWDAFEVANSI